MRTFSRVLALILTLFLVACAEPLPDSKKTYIGLWENEDKSFSLRINPDGEVNYARKTGNNTVTVNAPLKEFQEDGFIVGVWFMTTHFKVTEMPNEKDGRWQMVVDDVRLFRQ